MTMSDDIKDLREKVTKVCNDVSWIRKEMEGNGSKGIIEKTAENTEFRQNYEKVIERLSENVEINSNFRQQTEGMQKTIKFLIGVVGVLVVSVIGLSIQVWNTLH